MPSIAAFVRELLAEEKYGSEFAQKIDERIQELNASQLQGLYNHLTKTAKDSKSKLWKDANIHLISKIEGVLAERMRVVNEEKKIIEEERLKRAQKRRKIKEAQKEQIRVREMIEAKAHEEAEKEILESEYQRQAAEKVSIMRRVFQAEEKRDLYWKIIAAVFVLTVVGIVVIFTVVISISLYILVCCIVAVALLSIVLAYRAHTMTLIKPIVISPETLESQIEAREEVLQKQAYSKIRERERRFQEQERLDRKERKRLRAERLRKQQEEQHIMEEARLARVAIAKEMLAKEQQKEKTKEGLSEGLRSAHSLADDDETLPSTANMEYTNDVKVEEFYDEMADLEEGRVDSDSEGDEEDKIEDHEDDYDSGIDDHERNPTSP